jgi:hypothetical protein
MAYALPQSKGHGGGGRALDDSLELDNRNAGHNFCEAERLVINKVTQHLKMKMRVLRHGDEITRTCVVYCIKSSHSVAERPARCCRAAKSASLPSALKVKIKRSYRLCA